MMSRRAAVGAMVLAMTAAGLVRGQDPAPGAPPVVRREQKSDMTPEGQILRFLESPQNVLELGLTEEQVKKIRDGAFGVRKEQIRLRADLEFAGVEQARLLTAEKVDEKALMGAVEKSGRIRTELAKLQMRQVLLVRNNMTPEQHAKLREMMGKRMEEFAKRGGAGSRGGEHGREWRDRKAGAEGQEAPPPDPKPGPP